MDLEAACYAIITSYLFINYLQYSFNTGNSLSATMATIRNTSIQSINKLKVAVWLLKTFIKSHLTWSKNCISQLCTDKTECLLVTTVFDKKGSIFL